MVRAAVTAAMSNRMSNRAAGLRGGNLHIQQMSNIQAWTHLDKVERLWALIRCYEDFFERRWMALDADMFPTIRQQERIWASTASIIPARNCGHTIDRRRDHAVHGVVPLQLAVH